MFFRTSFFYRFSWLLMVFGSHLGSVFSLFSWFLHRFFEPRFYLDFSSIFGWIFHWFSIILGCRFSSVPRPREPSKLEQVWDESSVLPSQGTSIFHVFPLVVGLAFGIDFYLLLDLFFHNFRSSKRRKIRYLGPPVFTCFLVVVFYGFLPKMEPKRSKKGTIWSAL